MVIASERGKRVPAFLRHCSSDQHMAQAPPPAAQEFELSGPPSDGITNVTFCSGTPLLLVSSWDQVGNSTHSL